MRSGMSVVSAFERSASLLALSALSGCLYISEADQAERLGQIPATGELSLTITRIDPLVFFECSASSATTLKVVAQVDPAFAGQPLSVSYAVNGEPGSLSGPVTATDVGAYAALSFDIEGLDFAALADCGGELVCEVPISLQVKSDDGTADSADFTFYAVGTTPVPVVTVAALTDSGDISVSFDDLELGSNPPESVLATEFSTLGGALAHPIYILEAAVEEFGLQLPEYTSMSYDIAACPPGVDPNSSPDSCGEPVEAQSGLAEDQLVVFTSTAPFVNCPDLPEKAPQYWVRITGEPCHLDAPVWVLLGDAAFHLVNADCDDDGEEAQTDCDDADAAIGKDQSDSTCDGVDQNCTGVDGEEGNPNSLVSLFGDNDGDGAGNHFGLGLGCDSHLPGTATNSDDCDDTNGAVYPLAPETCADEAVDNNCNGLFDVDADEVGASVQYFVDADRDGYYPSNPDTYQRCTPEATLERLAGDCNDANGSISPAATEICDAANVDEDCDALADDTDPSATGQTLDRYLDQDHDGFGAGSSVRRCDNSGDYVTLGGDCDDTRDFVNPDGTEVCDSRARDEDCDTTYLAIDECSLNVECSDNLGCASGACVGATGNDPTGVCDVWAASFFGPGNADFPEVAFTDDGDIVVAFRTTGRVALGPISSLDFGSSDIVVAKYSRDGILAWARRFGGAGGDTVVAVTARGGHVAIAGQVDHAYSISVGTNSQGGAYLLPSVANSSYDGFVAVLDDSSGATEWATALTGPGGPTLAVDACADVVFTSAGTLYVAFNQQGDATGVASNFASGTVDVRRFNPAGIPLGSVAVASNRGIYATSLAVNASDDVYVGGIFGIAATGNVSTTLGSSTYTVLGGDPDMFVAQVASGGTSDRVYAETAIQGKDDQWLYDLVADGDAVYGVGATGSLVAMNGINSEPVSSLQGVVFAASADTLQREWLDAFGGDDADQMWGVAVDNFGNVVTSGAYSTPAPFLNGNLPRGHGQNAFIAVYSPAGVELFANGWAEHGLEVGHSVAVDPVTGDIAIVGTETRDIFIGGVLGNDQNSLAAGNNSGVWLASLGAYSGIPSAPGFRAEGPSTDGSNRNLAAPSCRAINALYSSDIDDSYWVDPDGDEGNFAAQEVFCEGGFMRTVAMVSTTAPICTLAVEHSPENLVVPAPTARGVLSPDFVQATLDLTWPYGLRDLRIDIGTASQTLFSAPSSGLNYWSWTALASGALNPANVPIAASPLTVRVNAGAAQNLHPTLRATGCDDCLFTARTANGTETAGLGTGATGRTGQYTETTCAAAPRLVTPGFRVGGTTATWGGVGTVWVR